MKGFLPGEMEVVVASFGGVGTSFLIEFISKYKTTNASADEDGFKHLPVPPLSMNPNVRFVYVYGDPIAAAASLFRRKYHRPQSRKLQKYRQHSPPGIPREMTLEEYAKNGKDQFHFKEHFYNWYQDYLLYPTLFVRYETLWQNLDHLFAFLNLPETALRQFPSRIERKTQTDAIPADVVDGLRRMYQGFCDEITNLSDVVIRQKANMTRNALLNVLLSRNFYKHISVSARDGILSNLPGFYKDKTEHETRQL